ADVLITYLHDDVLGLDPLQCTGTSRIYRVDDCFPFSPDNMQTAHVHHVGLVKLFAFFQNHLVIGKSNVTLNRERKPVPRMLISARSNRRSGTVNSPSKTFSTWNNFRV